MRNWMAKVMSTSARSALLHEASRKSLILISMLPIALAIATHEDMELHQVDVVGAYLQGDLDEEIYMTLPAGLNIPGKKG
jgi:hypothetical protein